MNSQTQKTFGSDFWFKLALIIIAVGLILKSQYDVKRLGETFEIQQQELSRISEKLEVLTANTSLQNHDKNTPILEDWENNEEIVKEVQRRLQALALYDKEIDGIHGTRTTQGLIRFQNLNGLDPTGELTEEAYNLLTQR